MSCKELYSVLNNDSYKSLISVNYKLESIVDSVKNIIGYECLVNIIWLSVEDAKFLFEKELNSPFLFLDLLKRLNAKLNSTSNQELTSLLKDKKLFINIERSCVCNRIIVNEIINFKDNLKALNIDLVLEVTEREISVCWACPEIYSALKELSENNVKLAADDYDIYDSDFRESELFIYDYVKVEVPINKKQENKLNLFLNSSQNNFNVIIERIQSQSDFHRVLYKRTRTNLSGYQGFLFGKSLNADI
ncbi:hypothetical protein F0Z19_5065 [Vibrio cyclitrophicus]|uniref:hypothetical protein n=1 Tax=unclassified Vibrio TaxID=2614977 RepID=UPI0012845665|nr:hypothetical protein F0Z19_5065 [Vibrio cyclitrophicus]